jgi:hypothetical protein
LAGGVLCSYRENLDYERLLLFAALEGHEQGLAHNRAVALPIMAELRDYLIRRQKAGALRNFDPALIVLAFAGAAQCFATQTCLFGYDAGGLTDEHVIETFTEIILNGLRPVAAPGMERAI